MIFDKPLRTLLSITVLSSMLSACGGGGGSGSTNDTQTYAAPDTIDAREALGYADGGQPLQWDMGYVADLTGDGKEELLVYTSFAFLDQLDPSPYVVFGQKDGKFQVITDDLFPDGPPEAVGNRNLEIADFNGDGFNDLFLDNHGTEAVDPFPGEQNQLYMSDGEGHWFDATATHLPEIRDFSHGSTVGNIDNDEEPEIIVVNLGGGEPGFGGLNYLLDQNENGVYELVADFRDNFGDIFPVGLQDIGSPFFSTFVDLNSNGVMDFFGGPVTFPNIDSPGYGYMALLNDGAGAFEVAAPGSLPEPRTFPQYDPPVGVPEALITGDIDGDGNKDIFAYDRYGPFLGSYFSVFMNQGDGTFTDETEQRLPGQSFGPTQANIPKAQLIDLNGDGHLDFIAKAYDFGTDPNGNAFVLWIYLNDGNGNLVEESPEDYPKFSPAFAVLDTNGDGLNDIVTQDGDDIRIFRRIAVGEK